MLKPLWMSAVVSTWSGMRGCSSSMSIKTSPQIEWGISPAHTHTHSREIYFILLGQLVFLFFSFFTTRTFPFVPPILHGLFLLWDASIFLQGLDRALTDHGLPPELTVVNDFDDNGRHVEVLPGKPLWRWQVLIVIECWLAIIAVVFLYSRRKQGCFWYGGHCGVRKWEVALFSSLETPQWDRPKQGRMAASKVNSKMLAWQCITSWASWLTC